MQASPSFPDELTALRFGTVTHPEEEDEVRGETAMTPPLPTATTATTAAAATVAMERRNVYDDDKYFRRGTLLAPKPAGSERRAPARHELNDRLKQSILALAERESSDDDDGDDDIIDGEGEGGRGGRQVYGFLEEEEEEGGTATPRIRFGAADEEPDENEQAAAVVGAKSTASPPLLPSLSCVTRTLAAFSSLRVFRFYHPELLPSQHAHRSPSREPPDAPESLASRSAA